MSHKYTEIFFTDTVKQVQIEKNSRNSYAGMEQGEDVNFLLSQREADFIQARDSFYMASVTETGWPYIQHRGGPAGFMRVLDEKTLGFADFSGNSQYVSMGNFRNNNRVSLFFMDYPSRTRLKVAGRVSVIPEDDWEAQAKLEVADYRARVERGFVFHIEGFDWNCPQHITPRYTEHAIQKLLKPLQAENDLLKEKLSGVQHEQAISQLGRGALPLVISGIRQLTDEVRAYELRSSSGDELPEVQAGAHLKVPVLLENGEEDVRHYSICSNPSRRDIYEIAVLKEVDGQGGSRSIHQRYDLGMQLNCDAPDNFFKLHEDSRPAVLIAGGIGITPIKPMAHDLKVRGGSFEMHYAGRSRRSMAFCDRLEREFSEQITIHSSESDSRMNLKNILTQADESTIFYACGPNRLIDALMLEAKQLGIQEDRIRFERFSAQSLKDSKAIAVTLKRSDLQILVEEDQSILDALLDAGVSAPFSCKTGQCKSCAVKVIDGIPLHFDEALSDSEKQDHQLMCPCVSRAETEHLLLDL